MSFNRSLLSFLKQLRKFRLKHVKMAIARQQPFKLSVERWQVFLKSLHLFIFHRCEEIVLVVVIFRIILFEHNKAAGA